MTDPKKSFLLQLKIWVQGHAAAETVASPNNPITAALYCIVQGIDWKFCLA